MKLLIKVVLALVLLVLVAGVAAVIYVDSIAKAAVENSATNTFGVQTTLGSGDVKILSSEFAMTGVRVNNPEGFDADHFLTIDDGGVSLTLASLMKDTVELPTLTFTGIQMNLQKLAGKSNYDIILGNMESDESAAEPADKKKFIIREVRFTDINVHAELLPVGGKVTQLDVPIDEIVLTDVGSDGSGLTLSELSGVIMKVILAAVVSKGGALPGDIAEELGSQLANLEDISQFGVEIAGEALGEIGGAASDLLKGSGEGVGGAVEEGVGGILEGAGGLLGGNNEEDEQDPPE